MSLENFFITKKLALPSDFGEIMFGFSDFGYYNEYNGIYKRYHYKNGVKSTRVRHYIPENPRTTAQQARRTKFSEAMSAWQALTESEQLQYTKRARKINIFGHNLFISEYMKS
jgi:hypothetical protein